MEENLSDGGADKPVPLDYASPKTVGRAPSVRAIIAASLLVLAILGLPFVLLPSMGRARPAANRVKCQINLKSIAQGMLRYANDHGGAFPDSFQTMLLNTDYAVPEILVCPACDDEKAPGATPQEVAKNLTAKPGHLSYIYLGRGLTTTQTTAEMVLAYELPANHANEGMNVLFGDGHVDFLAGDTALRFLAELHSGHNPPRAEMLK